MPLRKPRLSSSSRASSFRGTKAWVVTVDMGYGHQRAAYPLREFAYGDVISINNYPDLPEYERTIWEHHREGYELISRFGAKNFFGKLVFEAFDHIQEIPQFYPRRDLSRPNIQLLQISHLIERQGIGKHLFTEVLSRDSKRPLVCTFFVPAFAAEYYGYEGDIYCQVCDADVSRTWVARHPKRSKIKYLAPNLRVVERLKLYGVPSSHIIPTGFPLPKENIGGLDAELLKKDLHARIINLDPQKSMQHKFGHIIRYHLGKNTSLRRSTHPLTLTFAVGGAGAQADIGIHILESLRTKILAKKIRLHLIAGTRKELDSEYRAHIKELGLSKALGKGVTVLYRATKEGYFKAFNALLRTTDILWTKPSELSFYTALGLPIIMAPAIGSQEDFNRIWLKTVGGGISQEDPRYAGEWLFDWVESGWLARAALNGFSNAPVFGTYEIEKVLSDPLYRPKGFESSSPLAV